MEKPMSKEEKERFDAFGQAWVDALNSVKHTPDVPGPTLEEAMKKAGVEPTQATDDTAPQK